MQESQIQSGFVSEQQEARIALASVVESRLEKEVCRTWRQPCDDDLIDS